MTIRSPKVVKSLSNGVCHVYGTKNPSTFVSSAKIRSPDAVAILRSGKKRKTKRVDREWGVRSGLVFNVHFHST